MKKVLAMFLIFIMTWQMPVQAGIILYWKINQHHIALFQCENRAKPTLHCNGKCFLQKQIDRSTEQERTKNLPSDLFRFITTDAFDLESQQFNCCRGCFHFSNYLAEENPALLQGFCSVAVQPPDSRI